MAQMQQNPQQMQPQPAGPAAPQLDPNHVEDLQKVTLAAMTFMYSPKTHKYLLEELKQPGPLPLKAGRAAAHIIALLYAKSQQKMRPNVMFAAGLLLVADIVGFMAEAGAKVTDDDKQAAVEAYSQIMMQMFNAGPQQAQGMPQPGQPPAAPAPQQGMIAAQPAPQGV